MFRSLSYLFVCLCCSQLWNWSWQWTKTTSDLWSVNFRIFTWLECACVCVAGWLVCLQMALITSWLVHCPSTLVLLACLFCFFFFQHGKKEKLSKHILKWGGIHFTRTQCKNTYWIILFGLFFHPAFHSFDIRSKLCGSLSRDPGTLIHILSYHHVHSRSNSCTPETSFIEILPPSSLSEKGWYYQCINCLYSMCSASRRVRERHARQRDSDSDWQWIAEGLPCKRYMIITYFIWIRRTHACAIKQERLESHVAWVSTGVAMDSTCVE